MSKKFTVEVDTLKSMVEEITPFNSKSNCAQFDIGTKEPKENILVSTVTIVNGGNMLKKEFHANFDGAKAPICKFNVLLNTLISYLNVLLAYQEDICFSLSDTEVTLKAGDHAELSLQLITDAEPAFPISSTNAYAIFQFNTANFLEFARKGCFLYDEKDHRNIGDRFVFACNLTVGKIAAYSTNDSAAARSFIECGMDATGRPNFSTCPAFVLYKLKEKCKTLSEETRKQLEEKIEAAATTYLNSSGKDASCIYALCKEENVDISEHSFSLLVSSFQLLKGVLKGTSFFRMILTDMHCILFTDTNSCAMFTLGSTTPSWYKSIFPSIDKLQPLTEVVVDKQTLLHGLSIFSVVTDSDSTPKLPAHVQIVGNNLILSAQKTKATAACVEMVGDCENLSIYVFPKLLQTVLNTLNNGNVYLGFKGPSSPIVVRNGSLQDETNSTAIVLPVHMDTSTEETKKESEAEVSEE